METIKQSANRILQPIQQASGLSGAFYLDQNYVANERDLVLAKSWAALDLISECPQPGSGKPIDFCGLPLLIINDAEDNEIKVFHNICRHRGMILVNEEGPIEGVIRCPYHSWTYKTSGELVGTPNVGGIGIHNSKHFKKTDYGLIKVPSATFMNVLFINLDGNAENFDSHTKPLRDRWKAFLGEKGFDEMALAQDGNKMEFEVDCNWKYAVENYAEAYHLPALHPELNATSPLNVHYNILLNENFSGQGTTAYSDNLESENLPLFPSWPKDKMNYGEYMCFYPNLLTGIQNNHAFVIILHQVSQNKTLEKLELFYIGEGATDDKFEAARATALDTWSNVFSEDIIAVEGMHNGRNSKYYDGGVYAVPLEETVHHFHQWVAKKVQENA